MNATACPNINKCPIFNGGSFEKMKMSNVLQDMYKKAYCNITTGKYEECARYLANKALGVPIPMNIMPNSKRSVEEIAKLIENSAV